MRKFLIPTVLAAVLTSSAALAASSEDVYERSLYLEASPIATVDAPAFERSQSMDLSSQRASTATMPTHNWQATHSDLVHRYDGLE